MQARTIGKEKRKEEGGPGRRGYVARSGSVPSSSRGRQLLRLFLSFLTSQHAASFFAARAAWTASNSYRQSTPKWKFKNAKTKRNSSGSNIIRTEIESQKIEELRFLRWYKNWSKISQLNLNISLFLNNNITCIMLQNKINMIAKIIAT